MSCRTSDQTTKHVAAAFIGWHNTIRDHKRCRTDMVCDNTDRNICFMLLKILHTCQIADFVAQCLNCIHIKDRIHILNNNSQTFKPHTCINILLDKICVMIMSVIVKL